MFQDFKNLDFLASQRTVDFSEPTTLYLELVNQLEATNNKINIARGYFIRVQIDGKDGKEIFNEYHEKWGIPKFEENILTVDDFKRGFLWRFRDHTTSWGDNQKAKAWFLTSPEARFVRRYEFWTWDNGFDECIEIREGSYKEILSSLLKDGDFEVLSSPSFSSEELTNFIATYHPEDGDFDIEEIIEYYIEGNPNYNR